MLPYDHLRVKNTTYGGTPEDLDWALTAHAVLAATGIKNSVATSQVQAALRQRINGELSTSVSPQSWTQNLSITGSAYLGGRNPLTDYGFSFLIYTGIVYVLFGLMLFINRETASYGALLLPPLLCCFAVLAQAAWQWLLGKLTLLKSSLVALITAVIFTCLAPLLVTSTEFSLGDGGKIAPWIFVALGSTAVALATLILRWSETRKPRIHKALLTDTGWESEARRYVRQKLMMNETYLAQHLAAARQAAEAEHRPLIQMCGNPVSYIKTAPADPTYKPWTQMLGFSASTLIFLVMGIGFWLFSDGSVWGIFVLAAMSAFSAVISYREYKRITSRS